MFYASQRVLKSLLKVKDGYSFKVLNPVNQKKYNVPWKKFVAGILIRDLKAEIDQDINSLEEVTLKLAESKNSKKVKKKMEDKKKQADEKLQS